MFGICEGEGQRKGFMSCPRAPPKGLAREAIAVAETRPRGLNQSLRGFWSQCC